MTIRLEDLIDRLTGLDVRNPGDTPDLGDRAEVHPTVDPDG